MLTTFYPPYSFGGDALGVQRLATAIAARGHDVTVIHDIDAYATLAPSLPASQGPSDEVKVIGLRSSMGMMSNLLTHQLGRPVVHGRQLRELLKPGAFDIIWYHNVSLVGGPGLLALGEGLKVYEAHEHWLVCPTHVLWRYDRELCDGRQCIRCSMSYRRPPQLWRYTNMLNRQLEQVDTFIAKSEFSRNKHHEFGFPKDMEVIPYFLPDEAEEFTDSGRPYDRPYFLFVGRLEKIKGLDDVIPAFASYKDADLLIIGTGEYEDELRRKADAIPNVIFVGRLAPEDLSRYYKHAIALIVPSVCFETFGIILIESFRKGTPVIARKIGPFTEIVERCGGGALFENTDGMVDAMKRLQQDADHRTSLAKAAVDGFRSYWSEEAVLTEYFKTLRGTALAKGYSHIASALEA